MDKPHPYNVMACIGKCKVPGDIVHVLILHWSPTEDLDGVEIKAELIAVGVLSDGMKVVDAPEEYVDSLDWDAFCKEHEPEITRAVALHPEYKKYSDASKRATLREGVGKALN